MVFMAGLRPSLLGSILAAGLAVAPAGAEEGNIFSNLFKYGGTTVPPSQPKETEAAYCPTVDVAEGGAALRIMGGSNVRTQISIGRVARECARREDGSVVVKVGVEARVLLGPAGAPGRFDVPVTIVIKHNEKVVTSRAARTTAVIGPGEAQTLAQVVVDDLSVPPDMAGDYDIEVGLGSHKAVPGKAKPKHRKPAVAATPPAGGEAVQ
jgi:hypothetical protein